MAEMNPDIFRWARETAGLTLEEAVEKLGIRAARGVTGTDRLRAFEKGEARPSRRVLLSMADKYRRPLLTFFLPEPPRQGDRGQDFRTLRDAPSPLTNATVDAIVREIRVRQSIVRSLAEDDEDSAPVEFIGTTSMNDDPADVAAQVIKTLDFDRAVFRSCPTIRKAFGYLRQQIESRGIYVLLMGNLGTHHTSVDADVFRGFAIADPVAPFIVINENDADGAWAFTLLHEFVHLMLGLTGISGQDGDNRVEQFCDQVAGMVLLPAEDLRHFDSRYARSIEEWGELISAFASEHKVSASMAAYRLHRSGALDRDTWRALSQHFKRQWAASRTRRRESRQKDAGGPSYYVVRRHRAGNALLSFVRRSVQEGELTASRAGRVLGVNPRSVYPMLRTTVNAGSMV